MSQTETLESGTPQAQSLPDNRGAIRIRDVVVKYGQREITACGRIRTPREATEFAQQIVEDDAREHFLAIYVDSRHIPIGYQVVHVGSANQSLVHPREVFQPAVLLGAVALVVLHNHPSGDTSPSREDHQVTSRLRDAGAILGIGVLDHIVWAPGGGYSSFVELGVIKPETVTR